MTSPSEEVQSYLCIEFDFVVVLLLKCMLNFSVNLNVYQNNHIYILLNSLDICLFSLSHRTMSTPTTPSPHSTRRMTGVHRHPRCCQKEPVRCRAAAQTQSVSAINAAATMDASTPAWSLSSLHQVSRANRQMVAHTLTQSCFGLELLRN